MHKLDFRAGCDSRMRTFRPVTRLITRVNNRKMDATRIHVTLFVLLCCQYGVSYKIYILPEPGAFCFGVFSGDDCLTWSEYSARPTFVDHSTTLIFTPGNYSSSRLSTRYQSSYNYYGNALSVANIKRFTMIGDGAQLQFQLLLSNIGDVRLYNLTLILPTAPELMFAMCNHL